MLDTTLGLTTEEAGKRLGVSDGTIRGMCRRGTLKATRGPDELHPGSGTWLIATVELDNYLKRKRQKKCKPLSDVDKGYLSGLLDGEGCLTCFLTRQHGGEWWTTRYLIQIIVKDEAPIKWLKEVTGLGYVFQRKRQKEGWKDLWGWTVSCAPACEVIEQILPYLKIKHRQAEIFLQIRDMVRAGVFYRRGKANDSGIPKEEWVKRQLLIEELHRLNDRGGKVTRRDFSTSECK